MAIEVIRAVNNFPGILQKANQIRDKALWALVDVNLMANEKEIKKFLSFIAHPCQSKYKL